MSTNESDVSRLKGSLTPTCGNRTILSQCESRAQSGQRPDKSCISLSNNPSFDSDAIHSQLLNLTVQVNDFCQKREFEAAHHIATCMIALAPQLAVGYCHKAELCMMQGNTFGAVKILNKGLARVPISSLEYDCIRAAEERAKGHMVDFVSDLPFDILCHVLEFIPDQQFLLKHCMLVCKTWRQTISQCVPIWKEVQVASENYFRPGALVTIGSQIKKLHARLCSGRWLSALFGLMAEGVFGNLKELNFYHVTYQGVNELGYVLFAGLQKIQHTIEVLQIQVYSKSITLSSVLFACPNLVTLKYTNSVAFEGTPDLPHAPRLTTLKLTLTGGEEPILKDQLETVLQACPNLRQLAINQCCTQDLMIFHQHCPHLQLLCLNTNIGEGWLEEHVPIDTTRNSSGPFRLAIRPSSLEQLDKLLQVHAEVLDMLSIDFYGMGSFETRQKIDHFKFEHLRMLRIVGAFHLDAANFLLQLLRGCQVLEEMSLCGFPMIHFEGFCTMAKLPLKRVEFIRIEEANGLQHYLERLGSSGSASTLTSLVLNECAITDSEIASLAQVGSLSELVISNYYNPISGPHIDNALYTLFQGQAAAGRLEQLTLDYPFTRSEILASIGKIASLRVLKLGDGAWLYYITDDDIAQFSENYPHIRLEW